MSCTECRVTGVSVNHDYSAAPHNTPQAPRRVESDSDGCETQSASGRFAPCQHTADYELVLFQIGTHDWIKVHACGPCTATIRTRHATLGPRGTQGVHSVTEVSS